MQMSISPSSHPGACRQVSARRLLWALAVCCGVGGCGTQSKGTEICVESYVEERIEVFAQMDRSAAIWVAPAGLRSARGQTFIDLIAIGPRESLPLRAALTAVYTQRDAGHGIAAWSIDGKPIRLVSTGDFQPPTYEIDLENGMMAAVIPISVRGLRRDAPHDVQLLPCDLDVEYVCETHQYCLVHWPVRLEWTQGHLSSAQRRWRLSSYGY